MSDSATSPHPAQEIDYRLEALVPWLTRAEPLVQPIRTEELKPLYETATKNLHRADGIVSSTALALWVGRQALAQSVPTAGSVPYSEALIVGLQAWQAASNLPAIRTFGQGIIGSLSAYVVQAWTVFETLMSDLWEVALNVHPRTLSQLAGSDPGDLREVGGKTISVSELQRYDYDLSGVMGTVLRAKFKFDSLEGIREAYRAAFGKKGAEALHAALKNEAFDTANAIRQVIVHRGGIVDEK